MYICQLGNGRMLKFENNKFFVEETGYPVPDCEMHVGGRVYKGQSSILHQILSYDIESQQDFMEKISQFEPMDFIQFKYTIWKDNIGGGCPARLQQIGKCIIENNLSEIQSFFINSVPNTKSEIDFPDDTFFRDYKDLIFSPWKYKLNKPNKIFRNNILMFLGLKNYSDRYLKYISTAIQCCMHDDLKSQLKYVTVIISKNNIGSIIFTDSYINNADVEYFYSTISKVSLCDGEISVVITDNDVEASFKCLDERLNEYYENTKVFRGSIERMPFVCG